MDMTWPMAVVTLGAFVKFSFVLWLYGQHLIKRSEHGLQKRTLDLEEKKFEVWKTMNFAQVSMQGKEAKNFVERAMRSTSAIADVEPDPNKVVSMFDKKRGRGARSIEVGDVTVFVRDEGLLTPERIEEITDALEQAREIPVGAARDAFLRSRGIEHAEFYDGDGSA